jgi:hypothetical protein
MSAVLAPSRRSTASPCPTSHIATDQSRGSPARVRTAGTTVVASPMTVTTAARSTSRVRTPAGASTAAATAPLTTTAVTTPTTPAGHGSEATGSPAAIWAMTPIAAAGAQATAATTPPAAGHNGASTHASSPMTVTTGANGSASRFAGTAYVGRAGASGIVSGQHATCAAIGTATAVATGVQQLRASSAVSGGPSTTIPEVASTDRPKANDRANHGSTTSITTAARAMSGTPRTGRPDRCTTRTTTAITLARRIDGSGRTSTTNPTRSTTASAARAPRLSPAARPRSTTRATTTAQFEPDTAVRCVSALASIAASVAGSRPLRSPIARPRSSAPPG